MKNPCKNKFRFGSNECGRIICEEDQINACEGYERTRKLIACKYCTYEYLPCIRVAGDNRCYVWGLLLTCKPKLTISGHIRRLLHLPLSE